MSELPWQFFGRYGMKYSTTLQSPPGEYFFNIISPQESDFSVTLRLGIYVPPPGVGPVGIVETGLVTGKLAPTTSIVGQFEQSAQKGLIQSAEITGEFNPGDCINGEIETTNIKGTTYELP